MYPKKKKKEKANLVYQKEKKDKCCELFFWKFFVRTSPTDPKIIIIIYWSPDNVFLVIEDERFRKSSVTSSPIPKLT